MPKVVTTEKWIERAILKHGNKYDYKNSIYLGCQKPINIICPIHGEFTTLPMNHLQGHGCPECGKLISSKKQASNVNSFIDEANKIHNYKYDYSKVNYVNNRTKVIIVCPTHGEFLVTPNSHLSRHSGCPKCGREEVGNKKRKTLEEFIKEAREVHGYKYDYSKVIYKNTHSKIKIICKKHGEFLNKIAKDHLHGFWMPQMLQ